MTANQCCALVTSSCRSCKLNLQ